MMSPHKRIGIALVGTESFRGKEIKRVLENKRFAFDRIDFFDPDVEEEYSKLTEFRGEPRVVLPVDPAVIAESDLVFLASDKKTDREIGKMAAKNEFLAFDLNDTFNMDPEVPVVVAGVNHKDVLEKRPHLIANPHPATIILVHFLNVLRQKFQLLKIVAFVLQPVSAFSEPGIEELADQSFAVLSSAAVTKKFFKDQVAFNLLSDTGPVDNRDFPSTEKQILAETARILGTSDLPLSLAIVQVPVFHTYAIMVHLELKGRSDSAALADLLKKSSYFKVIPSSMSAPVSSLEVAGKDEIFVGRIKKETHLPNTFWIWTVTDNLTRGSALNAAEILEDFELYSTQKQ